MDLRLIPSSSYLACLHLCVDRTAVFSVLRLIRHSSSELVPSVKYRDSWFIIYTKKVKCLSPLLASRMYLYIRLQERIKNSYMHRHFLFFPTTKLLNNRSCSSF